MANREEIREIILAPLRMCAHKPEVYTPEMCTVDIIDGLAQVGLVIKTGGEWCIAHGYPLPCNKCGATYGQAAVEPLI